MIYWHQPVGGLAPLMEPLLDYYVSQMEDFRENARRLFGCRGIYVSAYTCPGCGLSTLNVAGDSQLDRGGGMAQPSFYSLLSRRPETGPPCGKKPFLLCGRPPCFMRILSVISRTER